MKVVPDGGLLADEVCPQFRLLHRLLQNLRVNALIVTCGAHQIEKREDGVEWIPHNDNALISDELDSTDTLRVMSLHDPYQVVYLAFSLETHLLQLSVKLSFEVTV